jgi:hypothetical protein
LSENSDDHSDEEPPISEPKQVEALRAPKKPPNNYFNIRLIQITICLGKHRCIWHACIDTGSERTVCTLPYALDLVGDRLQFLLQHPANMPNLRSASGHPLKIMGVLNTKIKIGNFQIQHPVIVYDGPQREALLGNDVIKGNLIIDRSEKLKFADSTIPPVDIKYRSHAKLGSTLTKTILGPRQSALIALTVGSEDQYCVREAIVIQNPNIVNDNCPIQFINTCNKIDSHGQTAILAYNPSEKAVYIPKQLKIAQVHFDSSLEENDYMY